MQNQPHKGMMLTSYIMNASFDNNKINYILRADIPESLTNNF